MPSLFGFIHRRLFLIFSIGLFFSYNSTALNYFWIGNGGNWSSLAHWATTSGGNILHTNLPTATDDVFFDVNSFSSSGQVVTLNQTSITAHNIDFSGSLNNPSFNGPSTAVLKIYGSLTLIPSMTLGLTGSIQFLSTTTGKTIMTAGKNLPSITFNGAGGEWTFLDSVNSTFVSLQAGVLNTNNQTINSDFFVLQGALTRHLNMSASIFNLSANQPWFTSTTGLTLNCGTSVINCSGANAQFSGGGYIYNDISFTDPTGNAVIRGTQFHDVNFAGNGTINGPCNFHDVTFQADGAVGPYSQDMYRCTFHDLNFKEGHTYRLGFLTINGNLHANGSCLKLISIRPVANSNTSYITFANPVHLSYVDLRSTVPIGTGPFIIDHSLPFCCNGAWTYQNTPANMYWIGNGGNWNDPDHWSYTSGGLPAGCFPFQDNNVFFDANSFSMPGQSVTIDSNAYCMDMDWTGVTSSPTLTMPAQTGIYIFGSLTFNPVMNITQANGLHPAWLNLDARTPGKTVTTHGKQLGYIGFGGWGDGGEWTLQDSLTTNFQLNLYYGTLNTNNQVINAESVRLWGGTLNMSASIFNISGKYAAWQIWTSPAIHINCGTSIINMTNDTAAVLNSSLSATTAYTLYDVNFMGTKEGAIGGYPLSCHNVVFNGNGSIGQSYTSQPCTYNDVIFHKDGYIGGPNTFHNLDFSSGHIYKFQSGKTQTIANRWKLPGICTGNISLEADIAGTFASINKVTDSVRGNYLNIKDIHTGGGASFKAYNSINQGGNTGWNFINTGPLLQNPGPVNGPSTVCGGSTGIIFYLSPVAGAFSYQWTVPPGANIISGQGDTLIVVDFGNATSGNVQVQSSNGCNLSSAASSLPVTIIPSLTPAVSLVATPGTFVCPATPVSFTASTSGIGSAVINYEFKINGTTVQNSSAPTLTTFIMNGDLVKCIISLSGGSCTTSTTATSNEITMSTSPDAQPVLVNAGNDVGIIAGQSIQLNASADNGTYLWSPPTGLGSVNILNPIASPVVTTEYTLTVTTTSGCSASDNIKVNVKQPDCSIEPMNAFSPNGDGINDKWIVFKGACYHDIAVSIYNRYGSPVYQSKNYHNDWVGIFNGKQLPDGTYYAVIVYNKNGKATIIKTDVSILR